MSLPSELKKFHMHSINVKKYNKIKKINKLKIITKIITAITIQRLNKLDFHENLQSLK